MGTGRAGRGGGGGSGGDAGVGGGGDARPHAHWWAVLGHGWISSFVMNSKPSSGYHWMQPLSPVPLPSCTPSKGTPSAMA